MAFPMSENLGIDTYNINTGYIGEDTGILGVQILLKKDVLGTT